MLFETTDILPGIRGATAVSFLRLAASGKVRDAYQRFIGPGFKHHNPHFRGDADSLAAAMEANAREHPDKIFEVHHTLEEGAFVAVHGRVRLDKKGPDIAVIHIFRFDGDRIVELWDVGQAEPDRSPNEHGMF